MTIYRYTTSVCNQPLRLTQPPTRSGKGNRYWSRDSGSALHWEGNCRSGSALAKRYRICHISTYRLNGVQTLRTRDISDPRHFGTIETGPKCRDSSALVPKCPCDSSAPVPKCLQLGDFLMCDLSKNEQSYALYRCDRPTQR